MAKYLHVVANDSISDSEKNLSEKLSRSSTKQKAPKSWLWWGICDVVPGVITDPVILDFNRLSRR